jgi:hypothetical protein
VTKTSSGRVAAKDLGQGDGDLEEPLDGQAARVDRLGERPAEGTSFAMKRSAEGAPKRGSSPRGDPDRV